jgi:EAL domain-containing protein (putative c-di-GMP-specific phosphodiesterase class I)
MNEAISRRFALKSRLARAIEHGELALHYQPQAHAISGSLVGVEALLRWNSGVWGVVPPDQFIPLAEETGLIVPIGDWVLERACEFARPLVSAGLLRRVGVNLSVRQFYQPAFSRTIERILAATGLDAEHLELEITESMMVGDTRKVIRILNELKEMRVTLAIDDFGTGYSSLGYLRHFPIDRLKIDRSFIADVPASTYDCTLAKAVISLGHNLGLKVIAEGVETQAQLSFLARNGCDEVQGYLLSKPIPEDAVRKLLVERSAAAQDVCGIAVLPVMVA